jgi:hypothetical protein
MRKLGNEFPTGRNRRRFLQDAATIAGGTALATTSGFFSTLTSFAQDPPSNCPVPPIGGTQFSHGQDTRPIVRRKGISTLTQSELSILKQAFAALRSLPASDKRAWILQADVHALYCDQCSNNAVQIHGSWNFFPWHRAYLYYFERILGSLVGDLHGFRLPYWDWEDIRTLPSPYTTPATSANSLWDSNRRTGLATGASLPPNDGTKARVAILNAITDFATFGGTAADAGACENNPHNTVHVDVGVFQSPYLDMGNLGFAARDPIFFAHHGNIDKLWSRWNGLSGRTGLPTDAYKNPTDLAFLNTRWSFYDENQNTTSISTADVLNHEGNLRYSYQLPRLTRIQFLAEYECRLLLRGPGPDPGPYLEVSEEVRTNLLSQVRTFELNEGPSVALVLQGVDVPNKTSGNFDIFAVRGDKRIFLGTLSLLNETMNMKEGKPVTLVLDVTHAIEDLLAKTKPASILIFRRREQNPGERPSAQEQPEAPAFVLKAKQAQIRFQRH